MFDHRECRLAHWIRRASENHRLRSGFSSVSVPRPRLHLAQRWRLKNLRVLRGDVVSPVPAPLVLRGADRYGNLRDVDDGPAGVVAYSVSSPRVMGCGDVDDLLEQPNMDIDTAAGDDGDGTFSYTFLYDLVGNYTVDVMLGGDEVGGSGFNLHVGATAPLVETIMPTTASTDGTQMLTIFGRHFGVVGKASVTVGGGECVIPEDIGHVEQTQSLQIICQVPEGEGLRKPVQVMFAGQTSPALPTGIHDDWLRSVGDQHCSSYQNRD